MVDDYGKNRLGRGLAALIGEVGDEFIDETPLEHVQKQIPIEFIRRNPNNPRRHFDLTELDQLAESIRQRGIIQPIVVRAISGLPDSFEIVAGERRWRAAQRAELQEVPVVVIDVDDKTSLELAIIENVQRSDLNPIDEALGYQKLVADFGYSHNEIAQTLGKSRSYVANSIRILNLPESVQQYVIQGELSAGHARALLAFKNPIEIVKRVLEEKLTVRDLERLAQIEAEAGQIEVSHQKKGRNHTKSDSDTLFLQDALKAVLGLPVKIKNNGQSGEVRIQYKSLEELESLCRRLNESETK